MRARAVPTLLLLLGAAFLLGPGACGGGGGPPPVPPPLGGRLPQDPLPNVGPVPGEPPPTPPPVGALRGGVLATFDCQGEAFRAWVTNPVTVQNLLATWATGPGGTSAFYGALQAGPGAAAHNAPWSWSVDPSTAMWQNDLVCIPESTALPSTIEANLTYFLTVIHGWCPPPPRLIDLQDLR